MAGRRQGLRRRLVSYPSILERGILKERRSYRRSATPAPLCACDSRGKLALDGLEYCYAALCRTVARRSILGWGGNYDDPWSVDIAWRDAFPVVGRIVLLLSHMTYRNSTFFTWWENGRRKRFHSSNQLMMWLRPTIHVSVSPESVWVLSKQQLSIRRQRKPSSRHTPAAWFLSNCVVMSSGAFRKRKRSSSFLNRQRCRTARISLDILALHMPFWKKGCQLTTY